jgi:hypothetical protein
MNSLKLVLALVLCASPFAAAQEAPPPAQNDATATAMRLLDHLDAGRYADAEAMLAAPMAAAVPADKLKAVW